MRLGTKTMIPVCISCVFTGFACGGEARGVDASSSDAESVDAANLDASSSDAESADAAPIDAPSTRRCDPSRSLLARRNAPYDFDGDGCPDLVIGDPNWGEGRGRVWLLRGAPSRDGVELVALRDGSAGEGLGVKVGYADDIDRDGRRELVVYSGSRVENSVWTGAWWGTGGGSGALPNLQPYRGLVDVAAFDFDGNAPIDVFYVASSRGNNYGRVQGAEDLPEGSMQVADIDGDLRDELVSLSQERRELVVRSGRGGFATATLDGLFPWRLDPLGDVDGNLRADFLLTGSTLSLVQSTDGRSFDQRSIAVVLMLAAGDQNCDGYDDVRYFDSSSGPERVFLGGPQGPAEPTDREVAPRGPIDLDGDGCGDPVTLSRGQLDVAGRWFDLGDGLYVHLANVRLSR